MCAGCLIRTQSSLNAWQWWSCSSPVNRCSPAHRLLCVSPFSYFKNSLISYGGSNEYTLIYRWTSVCMYVLINLWGPSHSSIKILDMFSLCVCLCVCVAPASSCFSGRIDHLIQIKDSPSTRGRDEPFTQCKIETYSHCRALVSGRELLCSNIPFSCLCRFEEDVCRLTAVCDCASKHYISVCYRQKKGVWVECGIKATWAQRKEQKTWKEGDDLHPYRQPHQIR